MTMLLKTYETQNLLCNVSVNGATTKPDTYAFRGDLVLEEGEIADASGRRLPPTAVVKQAVMLEQQGKLAMMAGALIELAHLPLFIERYRGDLADGAPVIFYVENLGQSLYTELDGVTLLLQAHEEGAVWNTLADDLRLDKEDFKGLDYISGKLEVSQINCVESKCLSVSALDMNGVDVALSWIYRAIPENLSL